MRTPSTGGSVSWALTRDYASCPVYCAIRLPEHGFVRPRRTVRPPTGSEPSKHLRAENHDFCHEVCQRDACVRCRLQFHNAKKLCSGLCSTYGAAYICIWMKVAVHSRKRFSQTSGSGSVGVVGFWGLQGFRLLIRLQGFIIGFPRTSWSPVRRLLRPALSQWRITRN